MAKPKPQGSANIARNKRARFDYHLQDNLEAGLSLEGWEVKSLRAGKANIAEAHVIIKDGEAWLLGSHFIPLSSASTHVRPDPTRTRKLLLHGFELNRLIGATDRKGFTIVPLNLYWKRGRAKLEIALAKGKKKHDKRATEKERSWNREKRRILKQQNM